MTLLARRCNCRRPAREVEADVNVSMHLRAPCARADKMDNSQRRVHTRYNERIAEEESGQALAEKLLRELPNQLLGAM